MKSDSSPAGEVLKLVAASLALVLTVFYFAPLGVLLLNAGEVAVSPSGVLALSWKLQLGLSLAVLLMAAFLSSPARRIVACVIVSLAVLVYLQGNFFVWDYGPLDGTDIDWRAHNLAGGVELVFWLGLPLLAIRYHQKLWPHVLGIAVVVIMIQAASLLAHLASGKTFPRAGPVVMKQIDRSFFTFSEQRNVLVVVLDTFATPIFEKILAEKPELAQQFSGFTFYRDTLGVSPYTLLSIPTILSSMVYENAGTIPSFMGEAFGENSLPSALQAGGFNTRVVSMGSYQDYLKWLPGHDLTSVLYDEGQDGRRRDLLQIWDVTLFRYAPHFLKMRIYDKHKWLLQSLFIDAGSRVDAGLDASRSGMKTMEPTPVQLASRIFLERFITQASLGSDLPTFRFIHLFTSHPPFQMDSDGNMLLESEYEAMPVEARAFAQGSHALTEIVEILDTLKQLGIYDKTMVVIAADHGTDLTKKTRPVYKRRAEPLLLIKPFAGSGELLISEARTSLQDVPVTIGEAVGIKGPFSGYDILGEDIPADRVRYYYYFNWGGKEFWDVDRLPSLTKYEVDGPVSDRGSWTMSCELQWAENRGDACPPKHQSQQQ